MSLYHSIILATQKGQDQQLAVANYLTSREDLLLDKRRSLTSTNPHLQLINQDQQGIGIDQTRQLTQDCSFAIYDQYTRIIVLLFADQASLPAQNALLKIIEEPPANTLIVLVTSHPQALLPTIHSRCRLVIADSSHADTAKQTSAFPPQAIEALLTQLTQPSVSYSDLIEIVETYKNRDEAVELIEALLTHSLEQLSKPLSNQSLKKILSLQHLLLKCHQGLTQNFNVALTLEHHLFKLVQPPKVHQ